MASEFSRIAKRTFLVCKRELESRIWIPISFIGIEFSSSSETLLTLAALLIFPKSARP